MEVAFAGKDVEENLMAMLYIKISLQQHKWYRLISMDIVSYVMSLFSYT